MDAQGRSDQMSMDITRITAAGNAGIGEGTASDAQTTSQERCGPNSRSTTWRCSWRTSGPTSLRIRALRAATTTYQLV
eukprot:13179629-Heterocapsa_arctica.AAC.1